MLQKRTNDVDIIDSAEIGHAFAFEESVQQVLDHGFAARNPIQAGLRQSTRLHFLHAMHDDTGHLRTFRRREIGQVSVMCEE